ncbi:hypothetical protein [Actinacidiphila glaucinigra]|uniref:hypothetical protein n=1 Tax=Actinacidiphila glaucinigra TaxID=235986 RepID=UPI0035E2EF47
MHSDPSAAPPAAAGPGDYLHGLAAYRAARRTLLAMLGVEQSNRDPLSEFAERFVAALWGGQLAASRTQPHYDIETPNGEKIQVKYLANASVPWVNEHLVHRLPGVDWYVLVLFEAFEVVGAVGFPPDLTAICAALGKQHPHQERRLQFTRRNWLAIRDHAEAYRALGMRIWLPPFT